MPLTSVSRPNRSRSSSETAGASADGSMAVIADAAWAVTAATVGAGQCPAIAPVSPRQKST
jgi:hypothetical protein